MTRPKLVTLKVKAQWEDVVQLCVDALMTEPPRTDNKGIRNKVRVKFPVDYKFGKPFPKWVRIPCDDPNFVIREWCAWTLLDWAAHWGLSDYSSKDVYSKRRGVLKSLHNQCKEIGLPGLFDEEE